MKITIFLSLIILTGCQYANREDPLIAIQIHDRNGLTETINNPERLTAYASVDFLSSQPYKKIHCFYKGEGKNRSKITTYHPNRVIWQYLEAEEMRAHGAYREWFSTGTQKIDATVIGGTADISSESQQDWLFDGLCRVWDEQERLVANIEYQKGMLEGPSTYFFSNGEIEKELNFSNNKLDGIALEYFISTYVKAKTTYNQGLKDGESIGFFENGHTSWVENYSEGKLNLGTYHNAKGDLISSIEDGSGFQALFDNQELTLIEFKRGEPDGVIKKFTSLGELQTLYHIRNEVKQGEEIEFYPASAYEKNQDPPIQKLSVNWNDNKIHGLVKTWYNNGQQQSQREYAQNKKHGNAVAWYRSGSIMLMEEYEEESLIKGQYYKNNSNQPISMIYNGNGIATLYDEDGMFLRKVHYVKGKPVDLEN